MAGSNRHQICENPFASHRTRPGALPFCFHDGTTVDQLVERFDDNGWRSQIVGPRGAGKSTLLAALVPLLLARGLETRYATLRDGQRRLPDGLLRQAGSSGRIILVVDGYEQLALISRCRLRWICWHCGWGLLITTHRRAAWLPLLTRLAPQPEIMEQLFDRLLLGHAPLVSRCQARASFARHHGNLREVWFDLYDRYEQTRRASATAQNER